MSCAIPQVIGDRAASHACPHPAMRWPYGTRGDFLALVANSLDGAFLAPARVGPDAGSQAV